jgi:hypothetical protein
VLFLYCAFDLIIGDLARHSEMESEGEAGARSYNLSSKATFSELLQTLGLVFMK